jgi:hypothetical protein
MAWRGQRKIYERGRRVRPVGKTVFDRIMNNGNNKPWWQSRTIIGLILLVVGKALERAGFALDDGMRGELESWIIGGLDVVGGLLVLWGRVRATKALTLLLVAAGVWAAVPSGLVAGDAVAAKPELALVAGKVTEGRKFDLWAATQVYGMVSYSLDSEEVGGGIRLAYLLNDHVRVRADYYAAELDVDRVAEDTSLSLAFLYPVEAVPALVVYTITGIGVSDFEDPALELIAGLGVEYELELWRMFGEYQYSSEDEDSVLRLGIGMNF